VRHCDRAGALVWAMLLAGLLLPALGYAQGPLAARLDGLNNLVTVQIEGVEGELLANVRAHLSLEQRKADKTLTDRWVRILHGDAPDEIRAALEPFGYYHAAVEGDLKQVGDKWQATYRIVPGDPVRVLSMDLRFVGPGAGVERLQAAIAAFPLKNGDVLDHQRYEEGKAALVVAASGLGYVQASAAVARVTVDPKADAATVTLHIDTGPRFYFGEVSFHQDILKPDLVDKFNTLRLGEPYNDEDVLTLQQGLQLTDWAAVVTVEPHFDQAEDGLVPLDVTLQPSKRNRFSFGVGYETDVGPRVSGRWTHRRINRAGHHSEVFFRLSPVRRTLQGAYYMPVWKPLTDRLAPSALYEYEETSDTRRNTVNGEFAFIRRSIDDSRFFKTFLEWRGEDYQVGGEPTVTTRLFSIGAGARYTDPQRVPFPQRGRHVSLDLRGASSAVLSDTSYAQLTVAAKYLVPVGTNGRIRLHGEAGASAVEFFESFPTSLRYFVGGDSSVRGYAYKSLGPEDDNGNVIGGKNMLLFSTEYDHRVKPQWVVAGFVDAGNAYNDTWEKLNVGAGFGFRWLSGVGSLKVDLGWPVSESDVQLGDVMLHLGFGAAL